ncbi:MAG: peptidoglycan DD-metalloendopeptidase family protein [Deltaproteobacteria bacterium]|nr:peptidoglycan DD-metalloendopeptidase family protein [Deltaproteobacteria bacterium]
MPIRARACLLAAPLLFAPTLANATPPLRLPWTCDEVHHVTNGHHTNTHTGMDAYAWDFGLAVGTEVRAPADGVVRMVKMDSSQGGCNSAYANDANYVVIAFADGTEALHMHLQHNSSPLHVGDEVKQGDLVGKVGLTGWVCGAHLHFQIQHDCGSWWCQSIAAEFVEFGDPDEDVDMASNNCPATEPCAAVLDGTETVVDDGDASCFTRQSSWFWPVDGGIGDGHMYTWANDASTADSIGTWNFAVDVEGPYRVEVHVPGSDASSQQARYELHTGAAVIDLGTVDQSTGAAWVDLGVHELVAGDEHWVRLADNTGEARDLDRKLAFDAIRLSYAPAPEGEGSSSSTGSDDGGGESGSGGASSPGPGDGETGDASETAGGSMGGVSGAADEPPRSEHGGCGIAPSRSIHPLALALLLGLGRRRRR